MESWAGPFSPCSAPNGGGLGALLSSGFALHSAERWQPQRSLSPDLLPVSLCSLRPHAGARAPYPAVLARPHQADTPDSKMASVGYHRYYNKYINVKKGGVAGVSMVLAAYVIFNYCRSYKELKHERRRKYH
ncbi:PREDICTED: ATP synthase subunit f, mitochondrial isoform X2 [Myotis davidii]|uniref:ATP synthase subunit f, mitochondrial isoform X2 n=1 Tax=Myotis davidii TaxID=225400 RepID=UPI000767D32E|nr:PREDICTED: ATP synthase subunit f, mitochondrial isoform X2 [Myotis davidii]